MPPPLKLRLFRVTAVVGGLIVGLLLAEGLTRILHPKPSVALRYFNLEEEERALFCRYSPQLGWEGIPGAQGRFEWIDCASYVHQNAQGFRGRELPFERGSAKRVAVLGDSFVWGFGVEEDEMFTRQMERLSAAPLEVINLGVSGYGTDQELLTWRQKGQQWHPDEVIVLVNFLTDINDNREPKRYGYPKPMFRPDPDGTLTLTNVPVPRTTEPPAAMKFFRAERAWLGPLASHSALASLAISALLQHQLTRDFLETHRAIPRRRMAYNWEASFYQLPYSREDEQDWSVLEAILAQLDRDVRQGGARLRVVAVPSISEVYDESWERVSRGSPPPDRAWARTAATDHLIAIGARLHVPVIDLTSDFQIAGRHNAYLYFPYNMHWTAEGHRLAAERILREIARP